MGTTPYRWSFVSRSGMVILAVLAALVALFIAARIGYPGKSPVVLPADRCDASLWKHVYQPERLQVIEACTAVEGVVSSVRRESDGDVHVALYPDHKAVLNLINAVHAKRRLVVEIICEHPPEGGDAVPACAGFQQPVAIPKVGDRVRVTGAYVTDKDNGWREIHPVTKIEPLP